jgi:Protein of unknown function (DUF1059)
VSADGGVCDPQIASISCVFDEEGHSVPVRIGYRRTNDDDVVTKAQEHAKKTHGMELSREQALSMARPA